uniref:Enoyl reductase (ER) domain-containing protein n=1 Tax=Strigamia maritima TaxID=126957 RepID=T1IMS6_STRMM
MAVHLGKAILSSLVKSKTSKQLFQRWMKSERNPSVRFDSYKVAVLKKIGKPLEIKSVSAPKSLNKDEVRITTEACGINLSDVYLCSGEYEDLKPKLPFYPGYEISGTVAEIGSAVENLRSGDRVVAINKDRNGGFAEQCIAPAKDVWILSPNVSLIDAASLVCNYGLGYLSMARRANINKDDVVVVTAMAGGLGLAALDLAANVYRTKVIGICPSNDHCNIMREKGAWSTVVQGKKGSVIKSVHDVAGKNGVKIVFDGVGGNMFADVVQCVSHEGSVIVAGFASKIIPTIKTNILLPQSFSLIGVSLAHYRESARDIYRETIEEVLKMAEEKFIEPHISATFPLDQVRIELYI